MAMKKLLNDPNTVSEELFEGYMMSYAKRFDLEQVESYTAAVKKTIPDRVAVLTGGGSGHEPIFLKMLGPGMADAAACGGIFAAPSPDLIVATAKAVERGKGVFILHGNYAGDNMNFDMAMEMLADEGIKTYALRVWDDVASAPLERQQERRGVTADIFLIKLAGALAEKGTSLDKMIPIMERARHNCRSMGVALTSATIPQTGKPTFTIADDEMEIGIGAHGEPGIGREKIARADDTCRRMLDRIIEDLPFKKGDEVVMLFNTMGATTFMEMYIMARTAHPYLKEKGISVHDTRIGIYLACQEMAGVYITLMKLDDELKALYDAPAHTPDYFCTL